LPLGSPTVAGLAGVIEGRGRGGGAGPVVAGRGGPAPLSAGQEGLWRVRRLASHDLGFNLGRALRIRVQDLDALGRALDEVVARHEALRTRFAEHDGRPVALVDPEGRVELERLGAATRREAAEVAAAFVDRPFDLGRGPLWRVGLVDLVDGDRVDGGRAGGGRRERVLVVAADQLVSDAWSLRLFTTQLGSWYQVFAGGGDVPLPPELQYGDFARWQQQQLAEGAFAAQIDYWHQRLAGATPLELPCDRARPAQETGRGGAHALVVPQALRDRLYAIGAQGRATLFMVLLAAFQVLLARHSGQDDVTVGTLAPGRDRPELESLIGQFENSLALRTDLSGDPSFGELLARVRAVALGAYSNQALPFDALVDTLAPRQPLIQVMFTLEGRPTPAGLEPLAATPFWVPQATARWDLSLELIEREGEEAHQGFLRYSTDLFTPATISRLAERYLALLDSITRHPNTPLSKLEPH
jgi:Condensation domain